MVWVTIHDKAVHRQVLKPPHRCILPQQFEAFNLLSRLDHIRALKITSKPFPVRLSGMICRIGRASLDPVVLEQMIAYGMNIACLNFAYGHLEHHEETLKNIEIAVKTFSEKARIEYPLSLAIETKGPRIRIGLLEGGNAVEIELIEGETIVLTTDEEYIERGTSEILYVNYPNITEVVKVGSKILIDSITLLCVEKQIPDLICKILVGGKLVERRYVTLPGTPIDLPALGKKDPRDLNFALEHGIDTIIASFTRSAEGIAEIRDFLGPDVTNKVKILAKIENEQGVFNIDEIIKAADGIVIMRAKLALEMSEEKVVLAQKSIIAKCNAVGKPVICTMQLMDSMIKRAKPTRAEILDVANAVLDGADCLMLCGETSKGDFLLECIKMVGAICKEAEAAIWHKELFTSLCFKHPTPLDAAETIALSAVEAATRCLASAIVLATNSGRSANLVAMYKPRCPIIAVTRNMDVAKHAHLHRGILPLFCDVDRKVDWARDMKIRIYFGINFGKVQGFIRSRDPVIVLTQSKEATGFTDTLKIIYAVRKISDIERCCCIVGDFW